MLSFVLVGLYFFGNFRINEVNVRDFLHEQVTWQRIKQTKAVVMQVYHTVKGLVSTASSGVTSSPATGNGKSPVIPGTALDANHLMQGLPLDKISAKDREKLEALINKTINESSKTLK